MGTRNSVILLLKSQYKAELEVVGACAALRILSHSWRKGTVSRQASRTKLEAGLETSTSVQVSRQALKGSRPWILKQNNMTKKGPFLDLKMKKKQARKNESPQFKVPAAAVAVEINFDLK